MSAKLHAEHFPITSFKPSTMQWCEFFYYAHFRVGKTETQKSSDFPTIIYTWSFWLQTPSSQPFMGDSVVVKDRGSLEVRMGFIALIGKYIKCTYQIVQDEK